MEIKSRLCQAYYALLFTNSFSLEILEKKTIFDGKFLAQQDDGSDSNKQIKTLKSECRCLTAPTTNTAK